MSVTIESRLLSPGEHWDAITVIETRTSSFAVATAWRPAVNAYRCAGGFDVFVDLAGVPPDAISVTAEPRRLVIRGQRPLAEPGDERGHLAQVLALEIDHGRFERTLELPEEVVTCRMTTEYRDGLLHIELPLRT